MLQNGSRAKANGASEVFAGPQSSNGKREAIPKKGKGRREPAKSAVTSSTAAYGDGDPAQAQSLDGSNGQYERYGKGEFFVAPKQALQDLQDKRIGLVAFAILCDVRSKGLNWQLRIREVRQRFSWGDQATRTAMRELTNAGWAQLERERGKGGAILGSYYVIRKMPVTETAVTRVSVNRSLIEDGPIERTEAANRDLGSKESLKSKAGAGAHEAFSWSVLKEGAAEIVTRFNKTFVPKGAQPLNKSTPDVRRILRHCGWGDYTAFEKAALADHANWRTRFKTRSGEYKRPGFVALWHKYKSLPKPKRVVRFADKDIDGLADWRNELRDESNALFRADKAGSRKRRAEIEKQIQAIEAEWECRTGRNAEELRMKHGAARSEREHEAIKAAPIIPWLNGSESKVA